MQLTKHTDLSLRVLMFLALYPDQRATIADISVRYRVSRNHLMKVVNRLATLGYIDSQQGRNGGITLALAASEIGVGDIVRAMEPTLTAVDCDNEDCPLSAACLLSGLLDEATHAFLRSLDNYSIADLIRNKPQLVRLIEA